MKLPEKFGKTAVGVAALGSIVVGPSAPPDISTSPNVEMAVAKEARNSNHPLAAGSSGLVIDSRLPSEEVPSAEKIAPPEAIPPQLPGTTIPYPADSKEPVDYTVPGNAAPPVEEGNTTPTVIAPPITTPVTTTAPPYLQDPKEKPADIQQPPADAVPVSEEDLARLASGLPEQTPPLQDSLGRNQHV